MKLTPKVDMNILSEAFTAAGINTMLFATMHTISSKADHNMLLSIVEAGSLIDLVEAIFNIEALGIEAWDGIRIPNYQYGTSALTQDLTPFQLECKNFISRILSKFFIEHGGTNVAYMLPVVNLWLNYLASHESAEDLALSLDLVRVGLPLLYSIKGDGAEN